MKKIIVVLFITLITFPGLSQAQTTNGYEFSFYANYWDVKDGDDNVWGPGIALGIPIYEKNLKLDLRAAWFPDAGEDEFGDIELIPLDFGLSYHFMMSNEFDLYPMAGGTYTFVDVDPKRIGLVDVDDGLGAYAGIGGAYTFAPNWAFFTNVYYRFMEFDTDVSSVDVGGSTVDADGLNVDLGVKYLF